MYDSFMVNRRLQPLLDHRHIQVRHLYDDNNRL